jgi:hypothetical protein
MPTCQAAVAPPVSEARSAVLGVADGDGTAPGGSSANAPPARRAVPVEPLPKGRTIILAPKALKAAKYGAINDPAALRAAIADTVGNTIGIDIFYDTTHTKNYARATLSKLLGIEVPDETDHITGKADTISTEELTILATVRPVGEWGGGLAADESITNNTDRLQAAVIARPVYEARGRRPATAIPPVGGGDPTSRQDSHPGPFHAMPVGWRGGVAESATPLAPAIALWLSEPCRCYLPLRPFGLPAAASNASMMLAGSGRVRRSRARSCGPTHGWPGSVPGCGRRRCRHPRKRGWWCRVWRVPRCGGPR